jgi:hypothetical protein
VPLAGRVSAELPRGELRERLAANDAVLKSYQDPVRRQARTSYTYAQLALAAGFMTLIGGAAASAHHCG